MESIGQSEVRVIPGIGRSKLTMVELVNVTKLPAHIERREIVARATSLDQEVQREKQPAQQPHNLTQEQSEKLKELLDRHQDLFVTTNDAIGIVPFIQHRIDTGSAEPIRSQSPTASQWQSKRSSRISSTKC